MRFSHIARTIGRNHPSRAWNLYERLVSESGRRGHQLVLRAISHALTSCSRCQPTPRQLVIALGGGALDVLLTNSFEFRACVRAGWRLVNCRSQIYACGSFARKHTSRACASCVARCIDRQGSTVDSGAQPVIHCTNNNRAHAAQGTLLFTLPISWVAQRKARKLA